VRVESGVVRVSTRSRFDIVNVTSSVMGWLDSINAGDGMLVVYSPHTTAAILINEDESGLREDILEFIRELTRPDAGWLHNRIDVNAHAHLGQIIIGNSRVIPVVNGRMGLGTWQSILFIEMDGPRDRRLHLTYIGT